MGPGGTIYNYSMYDATGVRISSGVVWFPKRGATSSGSMVAVCNPYCYIGPINIESYSTLNFTGRYYGSAPAYGYQNVLVGFYPLLPSGTVPPTYMVQWSTYFRIDSNTGNSYSVSIDKTNLTSTSQYLVLAAPGSIENLICDSITLST